MTMVVSQDQHTEGASGNARPAIFIDHASPEDNAFTLWLGGNWQRSATRVWADVLQLGVGDDWQRKLEHALRTRAAKVLLVANPRAVDKQGVRNEIQVASDEIGTSDGVRRFRAWAAKLKGFIDIPTPGSEVARSGAATRAVSRICGSISR